MNNIKKAARSLLNFQLPPDIVEHTSPTYTIEGVPSPLKRARIFKRGVYDSQRAEKAVLGIQLRNQHNNEDPLNGILHFNFIFHFPYPKDPKTKKKLSKQFFHIYKPDLSNLIKMIEDICVDTEIITDDSIIASLFSAKIYSEEPKTTFQIISIKGENEK